MHATRPSGTPHMSSATTRAMTPGSRPGPTCGGSLGLTRGATPDQTHAMTPDLTQGWTPGWRTPDMMPELTPDMIPVIQGLTRDTTREPTPGIALCYGLGPGSGVDMVMPKTAAHHTTSHHAPAAPYQHGKARRHATPHPTPPIRSTPHPIPPHPTLPTTPLPLHATRHHPTSHHPRPLHSTPLSPHPTPLHSISLLHCTALHSTSLHSTPLHSTPLRTTPHHTTRARFISRILILFCCPGMTQELTPDMIPDAMPDLTQGLISDMTPSKSPDLTSGMSPANIRSTTPARILSTIPVMNPGRTWKHGKSTAAAGGTRGMILRTTALAGWRILICGLPAPRANGRTGSRLMPVHTSQGATCGKQAGIGGGSARLHTGHGAWSPPPPPPLRSPCQEKDPADAHQCWIVGKPGMDSECASGCTWSTARPQPVSGTADSGVVKQDKSSRGFVDTTKTRSGPQRVSAVARGQ